MQYPIIDNLIYAYLSNGWTGFDENNLISLNGFIFGEWYSWDGNIETNATYGAHTDFIEIMVSGTYSLSINPVNSYSFVIFDSNKEFISRAQNTSQITINAGNYIIFQLSSSFNVGIHITQEYINNANPVITNTTGQTINIDFFKNDLSNRLKLPMIHYFPHPVIDALQRASAGIQTADDTEILRHYLTPLGIGGI